MTGIYTPNCRKVADEVVELGETLFDAVLDAAATHSRAEESEPLPETELRTAAEEFFKTVRLLLGIASDGPEGSNDTTSD